MEEKVITHMRLGHTGFNFILDEIGQHPTGLCALCNQPETVQHVVLECEIYTEERRDLRTQLKEEEKQCVQDEREHLLAKASWKVLSALIK